MVHVGRWCQRFFSPPYCPTLSGGGQPLAEFIAYSDCTNPLRHRTIFFLVFTRSVTLNHAYHHCLHKSFVFHAADVLPLFINPLIATYGFLFVAKWSGKAANVLIIFFWVLEFKLHRVSIKKFTLLFL